MKGYKGFNKGMICRGKQYAENTVFEEPEAHICENGMHFCENPFDVLDYYGFMDYNGELNEFAEVEALDETETDDNRKFCTKKLRIGAKLSLAEFIQICAETTADLNNSADNAQISSSGIDIRIGSSGYAARIGSSGDVTRIGSSGDAARIVSSGDVARIVSSGEDCVICCAGIGSRAKAKKGSWITLAEWEWSEEKEDYIPVCVKAEQVDGERIKEDVFYTLKDGEFWEVNP